MKVRVIKDKMGYRPQAQGSAGEWQYIEEKGWFKKTYETWVMFTEHGTVCSSQEAAVDVLKRYSAHLNSLDNRQTVVYEADWT